MVVSDAYLTSSIATASPERLVLLLYDGALAAVSRAAAAMTGCAPDRVERIHNELSRAQAIVVELRASLDRAQGGDIARNLDALYAYYVELLIGANVRKDPAGLDVVREGLAGLRDAWARACCSA